MLTASPLLAPVGFSVLKETGPDPTEDQVQLPAVFWKDHHAGLPSDRQLVTAAFPLFWFGRMIGTATEIDDHLNRGRAM